MKKQYTGSWESVRTHKVPQWYEDCKLGIFIHWGIYSVPAYAPVTWELGEIEANEQWFCNNPYAEWYSNSVRVGRGPSYEYHIKTYGRDFKYEDFISEWHAENWNPDQWAQLFKKAGAKYIVLTTKHHDGFCLFPSKYTGFHTQNKGPKRDLTGELTNAVRNAGLEMGLYYSGLIDWQFADDPIFKEEDSFGNACPTFAYADYCYNQMKELIDTYKPSLLWNDIGWPKQSEAALPHLLAHYYNTVENGVVNDRFNGLYHDYTTKEYQSGSENRNEKWEMCRGLGLSFGYNQNEGEEHLLSSTDLILLLVRTVANNGNLLLNIGPRADGTIPIEQELRLLELGKWLEINGEGIYVTKCSRASESREEGIELHYTAKENNLYIFLYGLQAERSVIPIANINGEVMPLDSRLEIETEARGNDLILTINNYQKDMHMVAFKVINQT
ncbi:MAG: alpha-L-fucosidase [Lachnospiraceae bacterium]